MYLLARVLRNPIPHEFVFHQLALCMETEVEHGQHNENATLV